MSTISENKNEEDVKRLSLLIPHSTAVIFQILETVGKINLLLTAVFEIFEV